VPPVRLFHRFSLVIQGVYIAWREKSNLLTTLSRIISKMPGQNKIFTYDDVKIKDKCQNL